MLVQDKNTFSNYILVYSGWLSPFLFFFLDVSESGIGWNEWNGNEMRSRLVNYYQEPRALSLGFASPSAGVFVCAILCGSSASSRSTSSGYVGVLGLRLAHPIICRHDCQRWKRDGSVLTAVPDFDECTFASSAYRLQQNLTVFRIPARNFVRQRYKPETESSGTAYPSTRS